MVNFQYPRAALNTGSFLEVLVASAVPNAALQGCNRGSKSSSCTASEYLLALGVELGVSDRHWRSNSDFCFDSALSEIMIPHFTLPGTWDLFSQDQNLKRVATIFGIIERLCNRERSNLALTLCPLEVIRFEMNNRNWSSYRSSLRCFPSSCCPSLA